jgi:hypothetical protein
MGARRLSTTVIQGWCASCSSSSSSQLQLVAPTTTTSFHIWFIVMSQRGQGRAIEVEPLLRRWGWAIANDDYNDKTGRTIPSISINNLVGGIVASHNDLDAGSLCASLPMLLRSLMTSA